MKRLVMENAGLTFWPNLSLAIFFIFFCAIVLWTWRKGSKKTYQEFSERILADDQAPENSK